MLSSFRRLSKSKVGTFFTAGVLIFILAGFAIADLSNFGSGNLGFGMSSTTLASMSGENVDEREMNQAMERRLQTARAEQPEATYASIANDFEPLLQSLIDQHALIAFAKKFGFPLSKRLIDAEIAALPQTKGLNGKFSEAAYYQFLAQQRLTDAEVRQLISGGLLQRDLITPVATSARLPVGMITPYASMMLENREGTAVGVPVDLFKAGLTPTDADLQRFYTQNRSRYMVPEQRALRVATIGPEQVANVGPNDQEIAAYYNANKASFAAKDERSLTQVVVPDQATASQIAARAKGGATMQAAAAPAGSAAAVSPLTGQTRDAYASAAGQKVADAVFGASPGTVVGPLQSDFGWVVVKVDGVQRTSGKSLEQARGEIVAKLAVDKRKQAIEDLVDKVQSAVDEGSNFAEAVAAAKLPVSTTPLILANGASRSDPAYKLAPDLAPVLKTGFEIAPNDPPEIVTLPNDKGYAVVSPGQVVPASPEPLAAIRDRVAQDWINVQAAQRARAAAASIEAKAKQGIPLAEALKQVNAAIPPARAISARRIQIANAQGTVPQPIRMLFTIGQGKTRMAADPEGRGFFVVKVDKIIPGNAVAQPGLITQMRSELQQAVSQDYAQQFMSAIRSELKVKRNENAIQGLKTRLVTGS